MRAKLKLQYVDAVINVLAKTALSWPPQDICKPIEIPEPLAEGARLVAFAMPFYFNITIPESWFEIEGGGDVAAATQPGADA